MTKQLWFLGQFLLLSLFILSPSALSKNLEGRYGLGISFVDSGALPALSARYHFSPYASVTFLVGFNTDDTSGSTLIGAKVYRNAHREENMSFYVGLGAFILSQKNAALTTDSGFQIDGLLGAEFFLTGLPNLGFQFETGISVRTPTNVVFRTIGSGFANAGIHYYF